MLKYKKKRKIFFFPISHFFRSFASRQIINIHANVYSRVHYFYPFRMRMCVSLFATTLSVCARTPAFAEEEYRKKKKKKHPLSFSRSLPLFIVINRCRKKEKQNEPITFLSFNLLPPSRSLLCALFSFSFHHPHTHTHTQVAYHSDDSSSLRNNNNLTHKDKKKKFSFFFFPYSS